MLPNPTTCYRNISRSKICLAKFKFLATINPKYYKFTSNDVHLHLCLLNLLPLVESHMRDSRFLRHSPFRPLLIDMNLMRLDVTNSPCKPVRKIWHFSTKNCACKDSNFGVMACTEGSILCLLL